MLAVLRRNPKPPRIYRPKQAEGYAAARKQIRDGDVLAWRPTSTLGRLICSGTAAEYSHVAMAAWLGHSLVALEMLQWRGAEVNLLSAEVARWPGACDVYRPHEPYDGEAAVSWMIRLIGQRYGWINFAEISVLKLLPKVKLLRPIDSPQAKILPVCSSGFAWAAHWGGGRSVKPGTPDRWVTPGDCAGENFSRYLMTLYPSRDRGGAGGGREVVGVAA